MLRLVRTLSNGTSGIRQAAGPHGRRTAAPPVGACDPEADIPDPFHEYSRIVGGEVADSPPGRGTWA